MKNLEIKLLPKSQGHEKPFAIGYEDPTGFFNILATEATFQECASWLSHINGGEHPDLIKQKLNAERKPCDTTDPLGSVLFCCQQLERSREKAQTSGDEVIVETIDFIFDKIEELCLSKHNARKMTPKPTQTEQDGD